MTAPRIIALAGFAGIAAAILSGGPAAAQKSGGTLRVYHRENPPSASIHEEATISTAQPFSAVFNNLVLFDQHEARNTPETIRPDLASEWSWSADNKNLTMKLREGVTWHDGKPFTSADVKCTWDTITEKRKGGWRKNPRQEWYFNLNEVTTDGDYSVTFHLGRPQPSFLTLLAGAFSPVYPCHVDGRDMRQKPIGTGPFKVAEFKANDSIRLVRNENYWRKDRPYLDAIEWKIITNRSTRILAFIAGEFDLTFAQDVTVPLLKDVRSQAPQAVCELNPSNTQGQLLVNREVPPFDDERIRRAMMLSLDRKAFIDILTEGEGEIGGVMLPPPAGAWGLAAKDLAADVPGYGPDIEKNREEGRAIMKSLGYGPDNMLKVKVATRNTALTRDPVVILIDHLKQIYVEGEIDMMETSIWYARLARKDFSIGYNGFGIGIDDPDVMFYENYACGSERNYTNYCNRELQAKFDEQSSTLDPAKRLKLVHEIDHALQLDGARPVLYHNHAATCRQPFVKDITFGKNSQYNLWRFEDVWLDK